MDVLGLLAWARDNGVELATVSVGSCSVTVAKAAGRDRPEPAQDPRASLYRKFGGEVLQRAVTDGDVDENGLVPAVR